ncbi:MAG: zinc ABC transporter substrate-binding protein [Firmicutes bacterium]|nr:zinc ABC transporter substrate-binding protein [Bacillota bacterium]
MKRIGLFILSLMLIVLAAGCADNKGDREAKGQKLNIVATTTMLRDLVSQIGGEKVNVVGLMGPGIDPHLYKASAGDVTKMQEADLIVYNGIHLEGKMGEIFKNLQGNNKEVIAVGEMIDKKKLIASSDSGYSYDPHIWFDVKLWMDAANIVADKIMDIDAENKDYYTASRDSYLKELEQLDGYVAERIKELDAQSRILVTAHDAFNYFGHAYDFEVRGLQGISTAAEAGTRDVSKLADYIVEKQIKAIFVESSVPAKNVEALQEAVAARGFQVSIGGELFSDSTGTTGTEQETLIGTVKHNIDTIVDALK